MVINPTPLFRSIAAKIGALTTSSRKGRRLQRLVSDARQELMATYLADPAIGINEAAFLLGYQDPNSFYRAFRAWRGTSPAAWRQSGQRSSRLVPGRG